LRNAHGSSAAETAFAAPLAPEERELVKRLLEFPQVARESAERRAPHAIPIYAIRVADDFHRFYHEHRVLDSEQEAFRLGLVSAVQPVIAAASISSGSRWNGVGSADVSAEVPDRNLALELVRVTESAATFAARWIGRGDKNAADQAAVDAMRLMLDTVAMRGVVVIGEGEKDEAPMLFNGEDVGRHGPRSTSPSTRSKARGSRLSGCRTQSP
jgi:hypothetical protein